MDFKQNEEILSDEIRKLFTKESWIMHQINFNRGYITFALTTPYNMDYRHISQVLNIDSTEVIPLMELDNNDQNLRTWIYTIKTEWVT